MTQLITSGANPTGIFCGNDLIAMSAMEAMRSFGLEPGKDIAVIGCDDMPMAVASNPPLTTFSQNLDALGMRMGRMVLNKLSGSPTQLRELVDAQLIVRESDMPPPRRV
jgi:DNA-binding LacI/PurR family transcriptional regulator